MKNVLIFGIGGFVGPYLAQEFLDAGYKVSGSDIVENLSLPHGVSFYQANLLNPEAVDDVFQKCVPDIVVNLAAISSVGLSWKIPQKTIEVNVIGTLNILEAVKKLPSMPKVLLVGSSEEYDISDAPMSEKQPIRANNPYGISKVTQERFATIYKEQYGMKIYYVRPFNHTGVGQRDTFVLPSFCKQVAEIEKIGKPGTIKVGNLAAMRDFSHVKDIVRAYRMVVESGDNDVVFNIGSGEAHSLKCLLDYIVSLASVPISVEVDSERFRPIDNPYICCDNAFIRNELRWVPRFTVFDALDELFSFYVSDY